jgi:NADH dehydrogenase
MVRRTICILGGTGFVGRSLTARLAAADHDLRILTRRRERHRDLLVLPGVQLIEADVHDPAVLVREFRGCDAVINLVGILNERGHRGAGFERAHVALPGKVVEACRAAGVPRLLHMSALGAALDGPSHYQRTKALGEALVHAASDLVVTSFRPSVMFGPHDNFTNRFARLLRRMPIVFPLACPNARLQPVYVEDVVSAFVVALDDSRTHGQGYELCGPQVYTLHELVAYIGELIGVRRRIWGLGDRLSWLQAATMELVPGKPFSLDNYRSLSRDNVCHAGFPTLFKVQPARLESIAPAYLRH